MIYPEFERYKIKYSSLQEQFKGLLDEKERLFTKALPNAIRYDRERVQSSPNCNPLEEYAIAIDEAGIDKALSEARTLLQDWEKLLDMKGQELERSQDVYDKIYRYRIINNYGINKISRILGYSKSQVYRKLGQVKKTCDKMRKEICYDSK